MPIAQVNTISPSNCGFYLYGAIDTEAVEDMARFMDTQFDQFETVNMILEFADQIEINTTGLGSIETLKVQFRSLANVSHYHVINPPTAAGVMIDAFGAIIPVEAQTFDTSERSKAWTSLGETPPDRAQLSH